MSLNSVFHPHFDIRNSIVTHGEINNDVMAVEASIGW